MSGRVVVGPAILHVGERPAGDKKYATDEFVLAPPGTIVAPRPKNVKPTFRNAVRLLKQQAMKSGYKAPDIVKAAGGTYVVQPGDTLWSIAARMLGSGARWPEILRASGLPANFDPRSLRVGQTLTMPGQPQPGRPPRTRSSGSAPPSQPMQVAVGADLLRQYLEMLTGQFSQQMATELPLAQLAMMSAVGALVPGLLGVTDPRLFRQGLVAALTGGNPPSGLSSEQLRVFPTLARQQMMVNRATRQLLGPTVGRTVFPSFGV